MKKHFLQNNKLPLLWLIFHGVLTATFLLSLAISRPVHFNTSLFDILPPSHSLKSAAQADARLAANTSRAVTILAYAKDFSAAKQAAEILYARYNPSAPADTTAETSTRTADTSRENNFFDDLSLYVDSAATEELTTFLCDHRFALLDKETVTLLENGGAEEVAQDALGRIYSAFSLTDFSALERDPFDLTGGIVLRFLGAAGTSGAMSIKDDVLAAEKDGLWYVMLRGTLKSAAVSLTGKKSAVRDIYAQCEKISAESADTARIQFAFSGVPFHSYESASSAQKQVSLISTIGIVLVILLFLYVFRSLIPALVSAGAVLISCGIALVAVLIVFGEIHVLTFVFGTTLIGTCVDYSIHFFVHWKNDLTVSDGTAVRQKILRGISISFASTEICLAALFLAPFPFLKQVSVFLFTGLLSAFLGVVCLYPKLPLPRAEKRTLHLTKKSLAPMQSNCAVKLIRSATKLFSVLPLLLALIATILLVKNKNAIRIDNNLRDMYTMSHRLFEGEKITNQVLDYGSAGWYFLVEGASAEEVLQAEEIFSVQLEQAKTNGKLGSFLATSNFIPSKTMQAQSYAAAAHLVPLASEQFAALGFAQTAAEQSALSRHFSAEYQANGQQYITPQTELPAILASVTKNLWLGKINGMWYSCVLPLHAQDEAYFRSLAAAFPSVHFVNKTADIGSELNALTATMLKLMAGAFVLVIIMLFICYSPKTVLRIATIPLLVVLVTIVVLTATHISLGFFSVTGLVLTFGLGLDYVIYAIEGEKAAEKLNNLAILISFATTVLSFGALALIDFAPVHTIGLTVAVGLTTACLSAMSVSGKKHNAPHF
ncbi:MAG: MMPL family transporter [Treponema sp.]|nr:MMPL family transporter [Treponema sp.]